MPGNLKCRNTQAYFLPDRPLSSCPHPLRASTEHLVPLRLLLDLEQSVHHSGLF